MGYQKRLVALSADYPVPLDGFGSDKSASISHEPLKGIHVAKKHKTTILYLVDKVNSEMDHDMKEWQ